MNYKTYLDKKTGPSRMTRKRARSTTFMFNKMVKKLFKKEARKLRAEQEASQDE